MRFNEQHKLVLTITDWEAAGLTYTSYENLRKRGQLIATRSCPGRPVEIEFESLPDRFKQHLNSFYGDVYAYEKECGLFDLLKPDQAAVHFYQDYIIPATGLNLPEQYITQYIQAAQWLNLALDFDKNKPSKTIAKVYTANQWESFLKIADLKGIKIPASYSKFRKLLNQYAGRNYEILVSKKFGNKNTEKICDSAANWLVAQFALPIKRNVDQLFVLYNTIAKSQGWKALKSSNTIYQYLHRPEVARIWYGGRNGWHKAKEVFGYTLKTKLPEFRDALWYADGTKLNFFNRNGKLNANLMVYEVIDAYSEVLLGYHISAQENFEAQYNAFRMAIQFAGQKPYEIRYDNQGGHKKVKNFLDSLSKVGFFTQPYNGKSKTIESIFGRFQAKHMKTAWNFTGQNITAVKLDSHANIEFISKNLKHLPDENEVIQQYIQMRNAWNNDIHPKYGKPRIQLYLESINPHAEPLDELAMIELFWIPKEEERIYTNEGIWLEHSKTKLLYEVKLPNGDPDTQFREDFRHQPYIIKYDPLCTDYIRLYRKTAKGLQFISIAELKEELPRATIDRKEGDGSKISKRLNIRKQELKKMKEDLERIQELTGIYPETLIHNPESLGEYQKQVSNMGIKEEDLDNIDFPDISDLI